MREIKFRAWNQFEENFVDSDEYAVTFNGIIFKANLDSDTYNNLISNENLKIMQYTGLKDKNGVEIYEGDIVKDGSSNIGRLWEVKFNYLNGIEFILILDKDYIYRYDSFNSYHKLNIEVIGNIYENPELFKEGI